MCLLGTAGFGATMRYTCVEQMSTGRPQKPRPWKRIARLKRFATSSIFHPSLFFDSTFQSIYVFYFYV
jgi:hypothetical protein